MKFEDGHNKRKGHDWYQSKLEMRKYEVTQNYFHSDPALGEWRGQ